MAVIRPFQRPGGDRRPNQVIFRRTLLLTVLFGVLTFVPLLGKLWQIQIRDQEFYEQKAIEQQTGDKAVSANRGTIYDAQGNILAISATVHDIILSPRDVVKLQKNYAEKVEEAREKGKAYPDYPEPTNEFIARGLSQILGMEEEEILKRLAKTESAYQVIAKKTEEEVSTAVRTFLSENHLASGIVVQPTTKRYYPYSSLAAQVIGFVNADNEGAYGLEAMYEEELSGEVGRVVTAKNGAGTELLYHYEDYIDAMDGCDLTLTLNATIQHYCEKVLSEGIEKFDIQKGGFAIAMDPNSGAILGWANYPTYDLNSPSAIYDLAEQDKLALLKESSGDDAAYQAAVTEARNRQWRNKAVNDTYEPGSTFKSVVLAAALEEGVVSQKDTFQCNGSVQVAGYTIRCHKHQGHGLQTLAEAVMNSCNPAFMAIGQRLGAERFYQYLRDFGFLNLTEVDMQGESGSVVWSEKFFTSEEGLSSLATASFGQRFQVTPLQLLCATSAVVNGGHLFTPHVLDSITDSQGNMVKHTETQEVRQVISESTSEAARAILEQVVDGGTGKNAYVAGYRIGGKTGTSQTLVSDEYIVSFLGFAPADDPQVIVLVALDSPKPASPGSNYTKDGYYIGGGAMSAPLAGELLANILDYMGVEKQYTEAELSGADTAVPKVTQFPLAEAERLLTRAGFTWRTVGDGAAVTDQVPAAGAVIPGGSEVVLYLGESKPEETVTVPDLSGMTAENARTALTRVGLYMKATGASGYYTSNTIAAGQSLAAGTPAEYGTVVEVRFVDNNIRD